MKTFTILFPLIFCMTVCFADPDPERIKKAYDEIVKREAAFDASGAYRLFNTMHPTPAKRKDEEAEVEKPLMTAVNHHPLARQFREWLYRRKDIVAADTVKANELVKEAIAELKAKPRSAVERLPDRAIGDAEPVSTSAPVTLPFDLSFVIHRLALRAHMAEQLGYRDETPLPLLGSIAASKGRHDLIDYLVWLGLDPNQKDARGLPLLLTAVRSRSLETVDRLLFYGADRFYKTIDGRPLLYYAVFAQDLPMARKIFNEGDATWHAKEFRPMLFSAVINDDPEMYAFLAEKGANEAWLDVDGNSYLQIAIVRNCVKIAEMLLENGVQPSLENHGGISCLSDACLHDRLEMVELLLQHGANLVDSHNEHVLRDAMLGSARDEILHKILDAIPETGLSHPDITSCLLIGLKTETPSLAIALLDRGADPNGQHEGFPLLYYALVNDEVEMAGTLYEYGADVNFLVDNVPLIDMPDIRSNYGAYMWLRHYGAHSRQNQYE